jgi:transcription elongation GreA/GreB family factor
MSTDGTVVQYGSEVTIRETTDEVHTVEIRDEATPKFRTISSDSAVGRALMGARVGDTVTVVIGRGFPARSLTVEAIG